jgi:hypothetical protein
VYNFSNDQPGSPGDDRRPVSAAPAATPDAPAATGSTSPAGTNASQPANESPSPSPSTPQGAPAPATSDNPQAASLARFNSCRWQQPAENGNAAFCTHREVKPYAGTTGFDSDAWCPECQYYKLRRAPKKRSPSDDYSY